MPAAQQALSLLSRWPSAAAGTSSAVRGAACLLCQPAAHAAVLSHSNQWGCLPAPQLPQHSSAAGVDQHDAWRAAYCHLPQPCAVLPAIERRSTASAAVPLPLQPWAVSVPRRTALQPRARQQVELMGTSCHPLRRSCCGWASPQRHGSPPCFSFESGVHCHRQGSTGRTRACSRRGCARRGCRAL